MALNVLTKEKIETAKKIAARKICIQKYIFKDFQRCQECMGNISSPSEKSLSLPSFSSPPTPSRNHLPTLQEIFVTSQIKEFQHYPQRPFGAQMRDIL